jgi:hypothetical protein
MPEATTGAAMPACRRRDTASAQGRSPAGFTSSRAGRHPAPRHRRQMRFSCRKAARTADRRPAEKRIPHRVLTSSLTHLSGLIPSWKTFWAAALGRAHRQDRRQISYYRRQSCHRAGRDSGVRNSCEAFASSIRRAATSSSRNGTPGPPYLRPKRRNFFTWPGLSALMRISRPLK